MKIKMIEDWRGAHKLWSVMLAALGALASAISGAWAVMDPSLLQHLPTWLPPTAATVVFVCTILARLVQQPAFAKPEKSDAAAPPGD